MTDDWRIPTTFDDSWNNSQKRLMHLERRPSITSAAQILGPGSGPFAVLINDWDEEEATFTGVFCSAPGAMHAPDTEGDPPDTPSTMYWIGETFGCEGDDGERYGFQRLTRYHVTADAAGDPPVSWAEHRRRFFPQGDRFAYTAWEVT